jgi:hypothetical protein
MNMLELFDSEVPLTVSVAHLLCHGWICFCQQTTAREDERGVTDGQATSLLSRAKLLPSDSVCPLMVRVKHVPAPLVLLTYFLQHTIAIVDDMRVRNI